MGWKKIRLKGGEKVREKKKKKIECSRELGAIKVHSISIFFYLLKSALSVMAKVEHAVRAR